MMSVAIYCAPRLVTMKVVTRNQFIQAREALGLGGKWCCLSHAPIQDTLHQSWKVPRQFKPKGINGLDIEEGSDSKFESLDSGPFNHIDQNSGNGPSSSEDKSAAA